MYVQLLCGGEEGRRRGTGEAVMKENHLFSDCSLCVTQITQYKLDIGLGGPSYQTIVSHNTHTNK